MEGPRRYMGGTELEAYLRCGNIAQAQDRLADLLSAGFEPVIRRIVPFKLRGRASAADVEDVCSDAMVSVMASLD